MFELATLILVLYVAHSIFLRSRDRNREIERLHEKVAELSDIVKRIHRGDENTDVSEMILKMEFRDIRAQFDDLDIDIEAEAQKEAFEQLHYVEETISKSVFVPAEMPTTAESTL